MISELNRYIDLINNNDTTLKEINLSIGWHYIADIKKLMDALIVNPKVPKNITSINIMRNQLTNINIPDSLTALTRL